MLHNLPWFSCRLYLFLTGCREPSWGYQGSRAAAGNFFFFPERPNSQSFVCHVCTCVCICICSMLKMQKTLFVYMHMKNRLWGQNWSMNPIFLTLAQTDMNKLYNRSLNSWLTPQSSILLTPAFNSQETLMEARKH